MEVMALVASSPQMCVFDRRSCIVINPDLKSKIYKHLRMIKLTCKTVFHRN